MHRFVLETAPTPSRKIRRFNSAVESRMKQSRTTLCHDEGVAGWALKLRRAKLMRLYYRVASLPMGLLLLLLVALSVESAVEACSEQLLESRQ